MPPKKADTSKSGKEHFYINRKARDLYHLNDPDLLLLPPERSKAQVQAEQQTEEINTRISLVKGTEVKKILPAQFHAMKLLHELFHHVIAKASGLSGSALAMLDKDSSHWNTREYLGRFLELFPTHELYRSQKSTEEYLNSKANLLETIEESYLVWLNNQNPALVQFADLLSDSELRGNRSYPHIISAMKGAMQEAGPIGPEGVDLYELLSRPMKQAPDSLLAQLRFIRLHWAGLLEDSPWWDILDETITLIEDEDRYLFFEKLAQEHGTADGVIGDKEVHVPAYSNLPDAPANYSHDSSWMPEVVMVAKSTYVWLDQLSRHYGYPINQLQEIPDQELDLLAERGFTALWLIGLWQRSHASQKIKQLQGNPEAKASAYALEKYEISGELGGYDGYLDLRNRAIKRGIRLASDMVPNHTGIDSELVRERPDWFLGTTVLPYPNYTYNGPNLSADSRYGIHIEDGYWNRSDAAVTFKRVDHLTGDTRYIYHGNDGTNMPWNDTAQLNFLDPEVREGIIREILHVARMFPVIRFDAAMVLAKMHIQRLWYPLNGHTAGVPSRGAWSMSMSEFEAAIPQEFWREVVDRVAAEVPDTLLLAEAFWMLEGYFVRTLGMHRVYNSAFMHMLKKEDNASYRQLIKNTLEFDPEILKRYVNFMNNPDEDTAIAQFGKGDKYFGVCMMMLTMPGLPMIGHGQVEGLTEKYGMEYARAYYDEQPDGELVGRHYREIFPVMKKRKLFADVCNFFLFDLYTPEGNVDENIFAYSNRLGDESALVIFNNRYEASEGWIRVSAAGLVNGSLSQTLLADALLLPHDHDAYVVFRDHRSGLEYIRSCVGVRENGLFTTLNGYEYNLLLDFRVVWPSRLKPYGQICEELGGRGVASIETEALSMSLRPIHQLISSGLSLLMDELSTKSASDTVAAAGFGKHCETLLEQLSGRFEEIMEKPLTLLPGASAQAAGRYMNALTQEVGFVRISGEKRLKSAIGIGKDKNGCYRRLVRNLIALECIQEMLEHNGLLQEQLIDQWLLGKALSDLWADDPAMPMNGADIVDLFSCLLALKPSVEAVRSPDSWIMGSIRKLFEVGDSHFGAFMQFQHLHGKEWFRERRLTLMASWIMLYGLLHATEAPAKTKPATGSKAAATKLTAGKPTAAVPASTPEHIMEPWLEALEKIDAAAFLCGYEMQGLLKEG
ncbi:MAG: alpha-amylase [Chlorobiaceae bacterium]|nr:alpha-amylase [Chlorobiaceae bacterium]